MSWVFRRLVPSLAGTVLAVCIVCARADTAPQAALRQLIDRGQWQAAQQEITRQLSRSDLSFPEREAVVFEQDRMRRIRLDFDKTREQVFQEARRIYPGLDSKHFEQWVEAGAVEFFRVDDEEWYLNRAAPNLFRIHPEAKALKVQGNPRRSAIPQYRLHNLRGILQARREGQQVEPKTFRVTYTVQVKLGAVPPGETIRAWLPYPQATDRQRNIRIVSTEPKHYVLSPPKRDLSSIYFEKTVQTSQPTIFSVVWEYESFGFNQSINPAKVQPAKQDSTQTEYLAERPPHIVFSESIRELSREIVGSETNLYLIARQIFHWVDEHIPWAGAREYSTLHSLTDYALKRRHGDCGIQTMLFITMCRLNGIPAQWESGWTTGPDSNLHDWCRIYLEPYGWMPVDVSYGLVPSDNSEERWFYLGGMDSYRLVVNTDYEQPLFPLKTHYRSEIVDFQRGELEWRGGNLYFDQWTYEFNVEIR